MPRLQGLIFDLDGTLIDSAADLRQALNLTLQADGKRELPLDQVKNMTGDGMLPMLSRAYAASGKVLSESETYAKFQKFIEHYRNLKPDSSQLYPHVMDVIQNFRKVGVKTGICTNKHETSTMQLLEDLNVRQHFDFVAGGDTYPVHKPHPDHVRGVISSLKVPPENCIMIGDGTNDVQAAHGAGIPCIVVTHGYSTYYGDLGGDLLIDDFNELKSAAEKLGFSLA